MIMGAWGLWRKKGWTNPYITDGLIAMWDGIENAGWGEHDTAATTWKNLIANSAYPDFDIKSGGTWRDNCLQFNGFAAQSQTAWPSFYNIDLVYRLDSGYVDFAPNFGSRMRWLQWSSQEAVFSSGTNRKTYNYDFDYGNAMSLSMQYGEDDIDVLYIDGVQKSQTGTKTQRTDVPAKTCIGKREGVSSGYNTGVGVVWRIAIYSRALTAAEIAANYAIDKQRFNLP